MNIRPHPTRLWGLMALASLLGLALAGCGDDDPAGPSPASIPELFGTQLLQADGATVGPEALAGKPLIGIYYSSAGCPACAGFTPILLDTYHQLREDGRSFEVVLVSLGISEASLLDYMVDSGMPWLAMPPQSNKATALVQRYNVRWVPTLVIIDSEARLVSLTGREGVTELGTAAYDAWLTASGGG